MLAAGQPAAILLYCLAPQRLMGWPRRPSAAALALLPPSADLPQIGGLTGASAPAGLEAIAALKPALILDYGDTDPAYRAIGERIRARIGAPYRLLDGSLAATPMALLSAGALCGVPARAERLADEAALILARWRSARGGTSFYYARGRDGLECGFRGSLATEAFEGAGWINVAAPGRDIGRVSREQVARWDPEIIVTLDRDFAPAAARDPFWNRRGNGRSRRILLLPDRPFGWTDLPPSINRLLGCAWLAGSALGAEAVGFRRTADAFVALFYGGHGSRPQPLPEWL